MTAVMTEWSHISDLAISCGNWTISKALVDGSPRYTLWDGEKMVAIRNSAEELKAMAEREVEHV